MNCVMCRAVVRPDESRIYSVALGVGVKGKVVRVQGMEAYGGMEV
jgi:hypothetical protein